VLEFKLTRHHTGLSLWGDYAALQTAHAFIHRVVSESVAIEDKEGFVLGLAYDLRKAFEGQRSKGRRPEPSSRSCAIYGVEILWPVILVQLGVLRHAMAFIPTNRLEQAIVFELEHVVETALRTVAPGRADEIVDCMGRIGSAPYAHVDALLDSRCLYFIECPPAKRLAALPNVLESLDPMYAFFADRGSSSRPGFIPRTAFAVDGREWPDFEW
jgi:hypothetical protein